jgi:hypothetical protein
MSKESVPVKAATAKLTKQQLEYALGRLGDKIEAKKRAEYPKLEVSSPQNDPEAIYQFLVKAKAPVVGKAEFIAAWNNVYYSERVVKLFALPESFDKKYEEYKKKIEEIDAKWNKIKMDYQDKLYLSGEGEEALKLINSL